MAFKKVIDLDSDTTTALGGVDKKTGKKNPTTVEGYYIGSKKVDSPKAKSGFAYLHVLQTADGNLGVWGKTDLDRKMLNVVPGTMTRINQTGKKATKNGDMYLFQVEVDEENTIEVNLPSSEESGEILEDDNGADFGDGDDTGEDETPADEIPPARAQAPRKAAAAPSPARAKSLLGNRNRSA